MVVQSAVFRWVTAVLVVVAGVFGVSDLLGGPSAGVWAVPLFGAGVIGWVLVLGADGPAERRWLRVGVGAGVVLVVLGLVDAIY
jgi:hypothetical protein